LFVAQLTNGSTGLDGHLTLTQMSKSGAILGHMYLRGFGHAVAIGAEAVGTTTYLWTEADVDPANGRGRQIARFAWKNGVTLTKESTGITLFDPVPGASVYTCSVDERHGRLAVRYSLAGGMHINLYSLAAARQGDFTDVLATFRQPSLTAGVSFQGWAVSGSYAYFWEGNSYPSTSDPDAATSRLWCYDIHAGRVVETCRTLAGASLTYREAEGLAVEGLDDDSARLYFGFASGAAGDRRCNLFSVQALLPGASGTGEVSAGDVSIVRSPSALLSDFRVGALGAVVHSRQSSPGSDFGSWTAIGGAGTFIGRPAALSAPNSTTVVYATSTDGVVKGIGQPAPGEPFGTWKEMGIAPDGLTFVSPPSAVIGGNGRISLFALDANGWVYRAEQVSVGGAFGAWTVVGDRGGFTGRAQPLPAVNNTLVVYATGTDGHVRGVGQSTVGGDFGTWGVIGAQPVDVLFVSEPAAAVTAGGTIVLYALGNDGKVYGSRQERLGGPIDGWYVIGDREDLTGRPQPVLAPNNTLVLYARAADNVVYGAGQSAPGAGFGAWQPIGSGSPVLTGVPSAVVRPDRTITVHAVSGGDVWGTAQTAAGQGFGPWAAIGH
jgi:hypothetical protein